LLISGEKIRYLNMMANMITKEYLIGKKPVNLKE
jgi:hypothetical protein